MNSYFDWSKLKQLNLTQTILAFAIPSIFAFFGFRVILPWTVNNGHPKVLMWAIIAAVMLSVLIIIGAFLIKKDARVNGISIRKRLLIKKVSLKHWGICIGIMIVGISLSTTLSPTVEFFSKIKGLSIPDYMPFWLNPLIDPMTADIEVLSPNYPIKGNYLIVILMAITLALNILAEEIYFRA